MNLLRRAVVAYSVHNRNRKAARILGWLEAKQPQDMLLIGAYGNSPDLLNADIVEKQLADRYPIKMSINIEPADVNYPFMIADARDMPFGDDYVDFALANAIIEHVGQESDQRRMVEEMTRVARSWVITTPNKWFPIESHTSVLFLHWIPAWSRRHSENFTRLLSRRQLRQLLPPGAEVTGSWFSPTFTARYSRVSRDARSAPSQTHR